MKDWNRLFSEEDKQGPTNMLNVSNQKGNPDENFIPIKMTIIEKKNVGKHLKKVLYGW